MDTLRLLFLIYTVLTASKCSAEPVCEDFDLKSFNLLEGEAFRFIPDEVDTHIPDDEITWYKNSSHIENITTDEDQNIHYHGEELFFLNLHTEDSGFYTARHKDPSGECCKYYLKLEIFKAESPALLYGNISTSEKNKKVTCPHNVQKTCKKSKGNISWNKDNKPLEGQHEADLWTTEGGRYTCICTWTHNNKQYKSSGSRKVYQDEAQGHSDIKIISPSNKVMLADEGVVLRLSCSVFCGINVTECNAEWKIDENPPDQMDGYDQTTETSNEPPSMKTISTASLTIEKVSAKDFERNFTCIGKSFFHMKSTNLTLQRRESVVPLVTGGVCVLLFCVFVVVMVKCFTIDLVLFFRRFWPISSYSSDLRVYDAYVIYQMQSEDRVTEDKLCQFVTNVLPSVLEDKCGYRLFIQGRDDIPGEDRLELVEARIKQSRRLMVILTQASGSKPESTGRLPASIQDSVIGGFDWQVGIHHVLLHREMSVILIQLGEPGPQGYTHLPVGMQHLISKSAPIRWPEGSQGGAAWNSRFWKRVRYLMPARPAKKCSQSAIV